MTTLREKLIEARALFENDLVLLDQKYHQDRASIVNKLDAVHRHFDGFKDKLEDDFEKVKSEATISFDWLKSRL